MCVERYLTRVDERSEAYWSSMRGVKFAREVGSRIEKRLTNGQSQSQIDLIRESRRRAKVERWWFVCLRDRERCVVTVAKRTNAVLVSRTRGEGQMEVKEKVVDRREGRSERGGCLTETEIGTAQSEKKGKV